MKNWKKNVPHGFFKKIYELPDLGKKTLTTWKVLNSEVYLTCINFRKFHNDLKACLGVIRLPSWPENVKFSVKMQFFMFLTSWKSMTYLKCSFSECGPGIVHIPPKPIFLFKFPNFLRVPWKCSKSHFVLKFSRKNP